ncbi:hypothetical protein HDU76_000095 [Blyttiomyces sp. JEL0837]|nr:hypothetical protein HDU76_000095 [Blyttiomyces sp. JEL0837]
MKSTHVFAAITCLAQLSICALALPGSKDIADLQIQQPFSLLDFEVTVSESARRRKGGSVVDRLHDEEEFSRFADLIEKDKGLRDELEREKVTLFAPTNEAIEQFEKHHKRVLQHEDMKKIVRYHLVHHKELSFKDLHDGMLLKSSLKEDKLEGKQQRIRVSKFYGEVYLNMYAKVAKRLELDADNGCILGIEHVLRPPQDLEDSLNQLPSLFSTTYAALVRLGKEDKLRDKSGTMMVPDNYAWKKLGINAVYYLFSKQGEDDLKRMMEYHCSDEIVYSSRMMKEHKLELPTHLRDETMMIEAHKRGSHGGDHDKDRNESDRHCSHGNRSRRCRRQPFDDDDDIETQRRRRGDSEDEDDEHHEESPSKYVFSINKGEARIWFIDNLAKNGVIHVIDSVLIPRDVHLRPFQDSSAGLVQSRWESN